MKEVLFNNTASQPKWLAILRILLGLILLWKGIFFLQNAIYFEQIAQNSNLGILKNYESEISLFITFCSILGGFFIAVGLFTKWAAIIQIPIVFGAVFFVNLNTGQGVQNSEFVLSVVVLALLFIFSMSGSGILSADEYFKSYHKAAMEDGHTDKIFQPIN